MRNQERAPRYPGEEGGALEGVSQGQAGFYQGAAGPSGEVWGGRSADRQWATSDSPCLHPTHIPPTLSVVVTTSKGIRRAPAQSQASQSARSKRRFVQKPSFNHCVGVLFGRGLGADMIGQGRV